MAVDVAARWPADEMAWVDTGTRAAFKLTTMSSSSDTSALAPLPLPDDAPTRADQVIDALRSAIVSGRLQPGQILVERLQDTRA